MPKDKCYTQVKRQYRKFPSARASQAISRCRKKAGMVRKSKSGASLRRWQDEKWTDIRTGAPCGAKTKKPQYCRPTVKVSGKTPRLKSELSSSQRRSGLTAKTRGKRAKPQPIKRRGKK